MSSIQISDDGGFQVEGKSFQIPEDFLPGAVSNYLTLLRPIPDIRGGATLTTERRASTEAYLSRRAAAGVIPGFRLSVSESLSPEDLQAIHRWIAGHRRL